MNRAAWLILAGFVGAAQFAHTQTPAPAEFETASVNLRVPASSGGAVPPLFGGPGTSTPGLARCNGCTLASLVLRAFGIGNYQLSGPDWLNNIQIQMTAKVPQGYTTESEFRLMLRAFLVQRFKLAFHSAKEERSGYVLVLAKDGPKLKESGPAESLRSGEAQTLNLGGVAVKVGPGAPMTGITSMTTAEHVKHTGGRQASMEQLAQALAEWLDKPVVDMTGLKGKYDFAFTFSLVAPPQAPLDGDAPVARLPQPTLAVALRDLGLNLEAKRVTFDVLVIDHMEKVPTEN